MALTIHWGLDAANWGLDASEKEMEGLDHASTGPTLLFLVDNISKNCIVSLVRRLKDQHPDLQAMLLVNSQEAYARNPAKLEIYEGVASWKACRAGWPLSCVHTVTEGRRYLDELLRHAEGESERPL